MKFQRNLRHSIYLQENTWIPGKRNNEWKTCIGEIDEKLEASIEESNLYDALKGLQLVEAIPYTKIFKDNGYELDEESKIR